MCQALHRASVEEDVLLSLTEYADALESAFLEVGAENITELSSKSV